MIELLRDIQTMRDAAFVMRIRVGPMEKTPLGCIRTGFFVFRLMSWKYNINANTLYEHMQSAH